MNDKLNDLKEERARLKSDYEEVRQAWNNDPPPYENRSGLSDRLNEIQVEQELLEQEIDDARVGAKKGG